MFATTLLPLTWMPWWVYHQDWGIGVSMGKKWTQQWIQQQRLQEVMYWMCLQQDPVSLRGVKW